MAQGNFNPNYIHLLPKVCSYILIRKCHLTVESKKDSVLCTWYLLYNYKKSKSPPNSRIKAAGKWSIKYTIVRTWKAHYIIVNNMKDKRLRGKKDRKWYVYHDCNFVKMYILKEKYCKEVHWNDIGVTGCEIQGADFQ